MPVEAVTLRVADREYTGWTSVSVRRSVENLAGSFALSVVDFDGDPVDFMPGLAVEIYAGDDRLLSGYIDETAPAVSPTDHSVSISGRSRTADLVDCSAANKPSTWKGAVKLSRIVADLVSPFGIGLSTVAERAEDLVRGFALSVGESPLEAIQRLCAERAILPIETPAGNLHLTNVGTVRAVDALVYGQNLTKASAKISHVERFAKYIVRGGSGSSGEGWGATASATVEGVAVDTEIRAQRVKILKTDDAASTKSAQTRAAWEAQMRRGKGVEASVEIYGWRQSSGDLWRENLVTLVDVLPIRITGVDMLVAEIVYTQNESGTTAKMELKRAETFAPEPKKDAKTKKNAMKWDPKA